MHKGDEDDNSNNNNNNNGNTKTDYILNLLNPVIIIQ